MNELKVTCKQEGTAQWIYSRATPLQWQQFLCTVASSQLLFSSIGMMKWLTAVNNLINYTAACGARSGPSVYSLRCNKGIPYQPFVVGMKTLCYEEQLTCNDSQDRERLWSTNSLKHINKQNALPKYDNITEKNRISVKYTRNESNYPFHNYAMLRTCMSFLPLTLTSMSLRDGVVSL